MRTEILSFSVLCLLAATGQAQRTWSVAAAGGSGVDFTDIPPAVAAAADDDILLVRAGDYSELNLNGKGLKVLGEAGARVSIVAVSNISSTQRAVVTDFEVLLLLAVSATHGQVLLERLSIPFGLRAASIVGNADVRMSACDVLGPLWIERSEVTVTDSRLGGRASAVGAQPSLSVVGGRVTLSRCTVVGQSEFQTSLAAAAIRLEVGATVVVTDDGSNLIAAGVATNTPQPSAVFGSGSFVRDPRVRLFAGTAPPVVGPIETVRAMATLRALGAPVGGNVQVELAGAVGEPYALVVGLPSLPIALPHLGGSVGLSILAVVTQGVFTSTPVGLSLPVNAGVPPGLALAWQAVAGDGTGGFQLSNVATYARTR